MKAIRWAAHFCFGGIVYVLLEVLWRGYSHISMFIAGGLGFVLISLVSRYLVKHTGIILGAVISAVGITAIELAAGLIVNVWLGLGVWNYSGHAFNFMGQISLMFSILWIFLSLIGFKVDGWILRLYAKYDERRVERAAERNV